MLVIYYHRHASYLGLSSIFLGNVVITIDSVDCNTMRADTLHVLLKQIGSSRSGQKLDLFKLTLKQGAIYGWRKVKNHLHTDRRGAIIGDLFSTADH